MLLHCIGHLCMQSEGSSYKVTIFFKSEKLIGLHTLLSGIGNERVNFPTWWEASCGHVGPLHLSKSKMRFILTCMELFIWVPLHHSPEELYIRRNCYKSYSLSHFFTWCPTPGQGSNFLSVTLSHLKKIFNISGIKTFPYHTQSNGRLECFHSTLNGGRT